MCGKRKNRHTKDALSNTVTSWSEEENMEQLLSFGDMEIPDYHDIYIDLPRGYVSYVSLIDAFIHSFCVVCSLYIVKGPTLLFSYVT